MEIVILGLDPGIQDLLKNWIPRSSRGMTDGNGYSIFTDTIQILRPLSIIPPPF